MRLPSGGTSGGGPFHSQCLESIYAHFPGLVVCTPATVEDAYSMLIESVTLDDPVIFCEHKYLYFHL
ncbi:MAG: alpha-ketoacid dehydrogenase subunit beta, partial [Limisphaerales bacterium]